MTIRISDMFFETFIQITYSLNKKGLRTLTSIFRAKKIIEFGKILCMTARILTIVGARPQFIKSIFLSKEISKRKSLQEKVVNTGQHFDDDMSKIFFTELFDNSVQKNLNINNLPSSKMVARTIEAVSTEIEVYKPDLVPYLAIQITLAGAIAANKCGIKIAHVEGGVRNLTKIPEEATELYR